MIELSLTEEQRMLQAMARDFAAQHAGTLGLAQPKPGDRHCVPCKPPNAAGDQYRRTLKRLFFNHLMKPSFHARAS